MGKKENQEEETKEVLLPVGIDLGSYYARIAIIPNISSLQEQEEKSIAPNILANPQTGLRYTLALSTIEDTENDKNHYIFGDIAYRHLSRSNNLNDIHTKLFVRSVSSCSNLSEDEGNESSIAFFEYLCDIAYQGYNNSNNNTTLSATSLRIVLSLPSYLPMEDRKSIKETCNNGIMSYIQKKEGKRKKKEYCKSFQDFVVGVICDSSSLCIANDLTNKNDWKYAWCMNWGNSGYTITMYKNHHGILQRLNNNEHHNPNLSTKCIQMVLQQYLIQQFLQKNRLPLSTTNKIQSNPKSLYKLHTSIESTLRTFVRMNTVNIHIDSFYDGMDLNLQLSRPRLDMLVSNVYRHVQFMISNALQSFQQEYGSVDAVLVSGSGFQMPNMDKMLSSLFPNSRVVTNANCGGNIPCDEVVAVGCAKYAYHVLNDTKEHDNSLLCGDLNVPVCPFNISIAYCNDATINGSFALKNEDGTINQSWTIVPFMEDAVILPFHSTKSISFDEFPSCYYIIQGNKDNPLAKITLDKDDILKDPNHMLHLSLDIGRNYKVRLSVKNTGESAFL